MIYLASPYSHPEVVVRQQRFHEACRAVATLLASRLTDWPFWEQFDRDHLVRCDELIVLMLDGWRESVGVAAEIRIAGELGKPVRYLAPDATGSPTLAHVAKEAGR